MEEVPALTRFFDQVRGDPRIGATHISLYMAIFQCFNQNHFQHPISVTRKKLMELAKISGIATYHKCLKDLIDLRYINYFPSYNPAIPSEIYLLNH